MAERLAFVAGTGEEFSKARRLLQISLRRLAAEMSVPVSTLANWEQDARPLAPARLERWAHALEICDQTRVAAVHRATSARRSARRVKQEV